MYNILTISMSNDAIWKEAYWSPLASSKTILSLHQLLLNRRLGKSQFIKCGIKPERNKQ